MQKSSLKSKSKATTKSSSKTITKRKMTTRRHTRTKSATTNPQPLTTTAPTTITTTARAMAMLRRAPTGVNTMEDIVRDARQSSPLARQLAKVESLQESVEQEIYRVRATAGAKRSPQPDEQAIRMIQFYITSAAEQHPQVRAALRQSVVKLPGAVFETELSSGLETRFNGMRQLLGDIVEQMIMQGANDIGIRFSSDQTLKTVVNNFSLVWAMYNSGGTCTDPIKVGGPEVLGPIMRQLAENSTTKLLYPQLDDAHWAVIMDACFGMTMTEFKRDGHILEAGAVRKVLNQQLTIVQSQQFSKQIHTLMERIDMEVPNQRFSGVQERVEYYTAFRAIAMDLLAEHTKKKILPQFNFEPSDAGYFLMKRAMEQHIFVDGLSAQANTLIMKELENLCPIYVSTDDILKQVKLQQSSEGVDTNPEYHQPEFTPEEEEALKQGIERLQNLSQEEKDKLVDPNLKLKDPFYVRQMMEQLPPARSRTVLPHPRDKKRFDTLRAKQVTTAKHRSIQRPEGNEPWDFTGRTLPGLSEDSDVQEFNRDPNEFIRNIKKTMSKPKYTKQTIRGGSDDETDDSAEQQNARFGALHKATRPHPGAGQSEGAPLSQFQAVTAAIKGSGPPIQYGMPDGAYQSPSHLHVPNRVRK